MKHKELKNNKYKLSYYVTVSPEFNSGTNLLLFSARTASSLVINKNLFEALFAGRINEIQKPIVQELITQKFIVPKNEIELLSVVNDFKKEERMKKGLSFTVQPSANCQLGCGYCGQSHENYNLPQRLNENIVKLFESKLLDNNYRSVNVGWFGGEPLIGLEQMDVLSKRFMSIANLNNISYSATLVTNGLLLNVLNLERLIKMKVENIELTIDGTKEYHDSSRNRKNGKGSFSAIFRNLKKVIEYINECNITNVQITIRHNVNKYNKLSVFPFIDLLKSSNLHKSIIYYISPVHSWGNDAHLDSMTIEEFSKLEIETLSKMHLNGFTVGWLPKTHKKTTCIATSKDDIVIDSYGSIHKCSETPYVDLYQPSKDKFNIELNRFSSPFETTFKSWYDILLTKKYPCSECKILPICGGSCPKVWDEGMSPCPSIKFNLEDRMINNFRDQFREIDL